jgi:hypothetical protein
MGRGGISGITPFSRFLLPRETGSAPGPSTTGAGFAVIFVFNDLCFPGTRSITLHPTCRNT